MHHKQAAYSDTLLPTAFGPYSRQLPSRERRAGCRIKLFQMQISVRIELKGVKKVEPHNFPRSGLVQIPKLEKKSTLRELLASRCEDYGEKIFLIDPEKNQQYSYTEFLKKVNAVSNLLYELGVRQNDKIALLMPNAAEYLFAFFGIMQMGAVACPLNTGLKTEEIGYILHDSDSIALFTSQEFLDSPAGAL